MSHSIQQLGNFLTQVWLPNDQGGLSGYHTVVSSGLNGRMRHHMVGSIPEAVAKVAELNQSNDDIYFAPSSFEKSWHRTPQGRKQFRVQNNACNTNCLFLDIDCSEGKAAAGQGYGSQKEALRDFARFLDATNLTLSDVTVVGSGNGLHLYIHLDRPVNGEEWQSLADKVKDLLQCLKIKVDHSRTTDIASILRLPGTRNYKDPTTPKAVELKQLGKVVSYEKLSSTIDKVLGSLLPAKSPMGPQSAVLLPKQKTTRILETDQNISVVKSMLARIPADCPYDLWRDIGWSLMDLQWNSAEELFREWSSSASHLFDDTSCQKVTNTFDPDKGVHFGTLVHHARQNGYTGSMPAVKPSIDGKGGDVKNGAIFADYFHDKLIHVHDTGQWFEFREEAGWRSMAPGEELAAAKKIISLLYNETARRTKVDPDDPLAKAIGREAVRLGHASPLHNMVEMAKSEPGMSCSLKYFDTAPMLSGVQNGVLDLQTCKLLPFRPSSRVSKRCAVYYSQDETSPLFVRFLSEIQPDPQMRGFLQRFFGYVLTGDVGEQLMLFFYGSGANGKSVLIELLAWLLADYAKKIPTEMLMQHQRNPQGPSPDIVDLKGLRLAFANETEEGRRLAEARVKDLTGSDTLTGRVPYAKSNISFTPTHKLIVVGNHKPEISDQSHGMWRRVALIQFDVTIPEDQRDPKLLDKLKQEGAGILNWMLTGLAQYQKVGLQVPGAVRAATAAYRDEQDIIGEWIAENCDTGAGCREQKYRLYADYKRWSDSNGHRPLAQGRLTRRLNERGYKLQPDRRTVSGLASKSPALRVLGGKS